jgi:hypothetical protein
MIVTEQNQGISCEGCEPCEGIRKASLSEKTLEKQEITLKKDENQAQNDNNKDQKRMVGLLEPSQPSHNNREDSSMSLKILSSLWRHWACKNPGCKTKGDQWFMIKHPEHCRGAKEDDTYKSTTSGHKSRSTSISVNATMTADGSGHFFH